MIRIRHVYLSSELRRFTLGLTLVVLAGIVLRLWQVRESLWLDELHSSWVVADGFAEVAPRAREGNQSPLYFQLLWCVVQVLGQSAISLRLISLLAGAALIALVGLAVRNWSGLSSAGLLAAWLAAVSPDCIFYAQEARPYALLQVSVLGHAMLFTRLLGDPSLGKRSWFVVGGAGLFYLHYTALLFLVAEVVCWILLPGCRRGPVRYRWRAAALDAMCLVVLCLPSVGHLQAIAQRRENWSQVFHAWPPPHSLSVLVMLCGLIPLLALLLAGLGRLPRRLPLPSPPVVVWSACWFGTPLGLAWWSTWSGWAALFAVRYLVAAVVGAIVFASLVLSLYSARSYRWGLGLVLVLGSSYGSGIPQQWMRDGRLHSERREHWDQATRWLQQQVDRAPRPIFLCAGLLEDSALPERRDDPQFVAYCLAPLAGIYSVDGVPLEPLPTLRSTSLSARQRALILDAGSSWLVVRAGPKTTHAIVQSLSADLRRAGRDLQVTHRTRFGSLRVLLIRATATKSPFAPRK